MGRWQACNQQHETSSKVIYCPCVGGERSHIWFVTARHSDASVYACALYTCVYVLSGVAVCLGESNWPSRRTREADVTYCVAHWSVCSVCLPPIRVCVCVAGRGGQDAIWVTYAVHRSTSNDDGSNWVPTGCSAIRASYPNLSSSLVHRNLQSSSEAICTRYHAPRQYTPPSWVSNSE